LKPYTRHFIHSTFACFLCPGHSLLSLKPYTRHFNHSTFACFSCPGHSLLSLKPYTRHFNHSTFACFLRPGHSLGAGVAGVLGLLLKPAYPTLRVFAHAPPGGTLSPKVHTPSVLLFLGLAKTVYIRIYIHRIFGDFHAKNTVCTPYIYGSGQPYLFHTTDF